MHISWFLLHERSQCIYFKFLCFSSFLSSFLFFPFSTLTNFYFVLGYVLCSYLVTQSCLTLYNSMDCSLPGSSIHGDSPGKNTGVGCHALLQGIFPTQGLNPGILHCRQILYHLNHQRSPEYNDTSSLKKMQNRTSNFSPQIWSSIYLLQLQKIRDHPCYSSFSHTTFNPCSIPSHFTSKRDLKPPHLTVGCLAATLVQPASVRPVLEAPKWFSSFLLPTPGLSPSGIKAEIRSWHGPAFKVLLAFPLQAK